MQHPKAGWNTQQIIINTTFKLNLHYCALQLIELQTSAIAIPIAKMPMFEHADVWMGGLNMAIAMADVWSANIWIVYIGTIQIWAADIGTGIADEYVCYPFDICLHPHFKISVLYD